MMTGNRKPGYSGKYARKRRFSGKSLALLVSALVLSFAMIGGTLAWLADDAAPITNTLKMASTDIDIDEKFDGSVKRDVRVKNTGSIPIYVRVNLVINLQDDEGNVAPVSRENVVSCCMTMEMGDAGWKQGSDGYYYYTSPVPAGEFTPMLVRSITAVDSDLIPEGYSLNVRVLAQSVQSQGMKDGVPMVEAQGWPVTVQSGGSLAVN